MICVKVCEELHKVVPEGCSKLSGGIVYVVAGITINIQQVLAVLLSDSGLQARLASSHYAARVHHHADHVGKGDVVVSEKVHKGAFQMLSCYFCNLNGAKVFHHYTFHVLTEVTHEHRQHLLISR